MRKLFKMMDLPLVWSAGAVVLILLINQYWPQPSTRNFVPPWFGYGFIAYAVFSIIWAAWQFMAMKTSIEPRRKPKTIICSGPYRYSRNPIYTAMILFALGVSIVGGAWLAYLLPIGLFFTLRERFVKPEEIILQNQFGDEAVHYLKRVNRW